MKRWTIGSVVVTVSVFGGQGVATAGTPHSTAVPPGSKESEVEVGAGYLSEDAARFGRYTGPVESGFFPILDFDWFLTLDEDDEDYNDARYGHLQGRDLGLDSRNVRGRYGIQGDYGVQLEYDERPLFQELDMRSPLSRDGRDRLRLPEAGDVDTVDQSSRSWDIDQKRQTVTLSAQKVVRESVKLNASFSREEKTGRRFQGYGDWTRAQGFQLPAPIDQRTDQLDLGFEYQGERFQGRMGYHLSAFSQLEEDFFVVDDPTSADWANPDQRTLSLAPDNTYHNIHAAGAYAVRPGTQVSGEIQVGRAEQDEDFIADDNFAGALSDLPDSLDARINTTRVNLRGAHRLTNRIRLRGSVFYNERDNRTRSFVVGGRETRPHGETRYGVEYDADFNLPGRNSLTLGYGYENVDRELGDRGKSEDWTFRARLRSRPTDNLSLGVRASHLIRAGGTRYDGSTLRGHLDTLHQYHLADLHRFDGAFHGSYAVSDALALGFELGARMDGYENSEYGLLYRDRYSATATLDYFPSADFSVHGFLTAETGKSEQRDASQTLDYKGDTVTLGGGFERAMTEDGRFHLGMDGLYMYSRTKAGLSVGQDHPTVSSGLAQIEVFGRYQARENLEWRLAYMVQAARERDWARGFGPDDGPDGYILMGQEPLDYTAHLLMGSVNYRF